jgi:hypothetical protein
MHTHIASSPHAPMTFHHFQAMDANAERKAAHPSRSLRGLTVYKCASVNCTICTRNHPTSYIEHSCDRRLESTVTINAAFPSMSCNEPSIFAGGYGCVRILHPKWERFDASNVRMPFRYIIVAVLYDRSVVYPVSRSAGTICLRSLL